MAIVTLVMIFRFRNTKFLPVLNAEERIHLVIRQHWIVPTIRIVFWTAFIMLILFLDGAVKLYFPDFAFGRTGAIIAVARSMLLMTGLLGLLMVWTLYYLNVQVVTNERIIDITQKSLLNHSTSELNLDRFQDVTTEMNGMLANLFNYGSVFVQTAGEQERFCFANIADPHEVARLILELYEKIPKASPPGT